MKNKNSDFKNNKKLRKKAEERLSTNKVAAKPITETVLKKIVHELQVHQIELEMQNEELQKAYEIAESALKRYTLLFDFAPMAYFTLDCEANICELNFAAAELLGDKRFTLLNNNIKLYISEASRIIFNDFLDKIFSDRGKETCKIILTNSRHEDINVYMEGIYTGDDKRCLLTVIDITERH